MKKIFVLTLTFLAYFNVLDAQDGILDNSFDMDGLVTMDINNSNDVMKSIITQADGKIIVAGYTSDMVIDKFCLVRFNSNGMVDNSFGSNGVVITTFAYTSIASDVALQNDGKIIVAGHTWGGSENNFALARYNSNGVLDASFGNLGTVSTPFSSKNAVARTLKIQTDGKIVVGGHVYSSNNDFDEFAIARYNTNGSLDVTFGTGGQVATSFGIGTKNWINSIQLQNNGKIVAGGFSNNFFALARYNLNGTLDLTFGINGLITTIIPNTTQGIINSIALDTDESIFAGGFSTDTINNGTNNSTIVKYDSLGNPDSTFGMNGILVTNISAENDVIADILIQADNKLLMAGSSSENSVFQFAIARFDSTGNPDSTFGANGVVKTLVNPNFNQLEAITLQSDGKVLTTGFIDNYPYDLAIARYTSTILSTQESESLLEDVSIYPNPTRDKVQITFTLKRGGEVSIKLFDSNTRLLQVNKLHSIQNKKNQETFQLDNYSDGVYFIKISTSFSNQMIKIIKE